MTAISINKQLSVSNYKIGCSSAVFVVVVIVSSKINNISSSVPNDFLALLKLL